MTTAQWLIEYHALQMRDEQQDERMKVVFEAGALTFRNTLVNLLGLAPTGDDEIVPLSLMCGNPHVMQHLMESADKEAKALAAASDADFDALSEQLMQSLNSDGDMAPLLEDLEPITLTNNLDYQTMARDLGIRPRQTPEDALSNDTRD